MLISTKIVF